AVGCYHRDGNSTILKVATVRRKSSEGAERGAADRSTVRPIIYMVAMTKSARTNPTDTLSTRRRIKPASPPAWIKPQLAALAAKAPDGPDWLHEIKFDGYRMHARLDRGAVRLLTRTGLDWTPKYPAIAAAIASLPARQAYLDGELCGVRLDGTTSFSLIQNASDTGN